MPTPSKFRQGARDRAIAVLNAGGSRREAAKAANVDHATLHRWLKRGERVHPESRYARFAEAVKLAEADPHTLVVLPDIDEGPTPAQARAAFRFLERTEWAIEPSPFEGL
jgi:hypothetical protein